MAILAKNSGKWGIPKKNYKNVVQQWYRYSEIDGCSTILLDFIAKKMIFCHFPIKIPIKVETNYQHGKERA